MALVGLPGSGKSAVAGPLSARLGVTLIDLDANIAGAAGRSITQIFHDEGEAGFRARETRALRAALTDERGAVVSCGGGVVTVDLNRELLRGAVTVWLTAPLDVLRGRLARSATKRPLLGGDLGDRLSELAAEREPLYREVATFEVDVDAPIGRVVDRVVEQLETLA